MLKEVKKDLTFSGIEILLGFQRMSRNSFLP